MSSNILSEPLDVRRFGLIYAGAQKNLGPAGLGVVIIRSDLLERAPDDLPNILSYRAHVAAQGLYHTPPTFAVYMMGMVLEWIEGEGGLEVMARRKAEKSGMLYSAIDASDGFYRGTADPACRSGMNVTFRLRDTSLEERFFAEAEAAGLAGIRGHRSVGGARASLYNPLPIESVAALVAFMSDFRKRNG